VCDLGNSAVSLTNVNCLPRWIVYPRTCTLGAWRNIETRTPRQCLDYCLSNTSCATVQWDRAHIECWIHRSRAEERVGRDYVTLYEIVRRCELLVVFCARFCCKILSDKLTNLNTRYM